MKKRSRREASKPPGRRPAAPRAPAPLQYKVVELSTVDEVTLEQTLNDWVAEGWAVESVHFAMRDASKRPAMAFVFFTRPGPQAAPNAEAARARLRRLAGSTLEIAPAPVSARERLAQLAAAEEPES